MIVLTVNQDLSHLNESLDVGDLIYSCPTTNAGNYFFYQPIFQGGGGSSNGVGVNHIVGVLRKIEDSGGEVLLYVDNSMLVNQYWPEWDANANPSGEFLMFSKYSQGDSGMLGYYADVKLINNSKEKAEIFSVGSEVTVNSK